ncbi:MAG: tyrosine-type recombinase/integrase [Chloroflexi bacterium]|nr:tyrosine-type recombinase/integrase [Chloroflexota bacterium]
MATDLATLVEEFLLDCRTRRLSPKTVAWYAANLRYFLDWLAAEGQAADLAAVTLTNGRRYSQWLAGRTVKQATFVSGGSQRGVHALLETDRPLAANTLVGYLQTLKRFAGWLAAEEQGYAARDTMARLRLPKLPRTHQEPLRPDEMARVLAGYDLRHPIGCRDFAVMLTYLGTGLRATELTNLVLDDVHLDAGYLRVCAGKGNKTRAVNLPPEAARAMLRYRQHYRPASADPHFFLTRTGTALTYNAIKLVIRRARERSGIERLHAHLLRHTFSVSALGGGMDLMTLKETLGHTDIRTTSIYLSMSEQQLIEQQRKVNPLAGVALPKAVRKGLPAGADDHPMR